MTGVQPAKDSIADYIEADQLQTTAVSCFELLSGAGENKRGQAVRQLLGALGAATCCVGARHAAEVRRKLDRAGQKIGMGDSLIAGIALAYGLPLFTRNRAHFERVENLKLI